MANAPTSDVATVDRSDLGDSNGVGRSRTLECVGVRVETPTIKTFSFRDTHPDGRLSFQAGQAALLTLTIEGTRFDRTFSIASSPTQRDLLELTIKVNPDGQVSRWLHEQLVRGAQIAARYPLGRFVLPGAPRVPLALISGGSGASPLMSMLRMLSNRAPLTDVAWVHAARNADEILFADELTELQAKMPALRVTVVLDKPAPGWFGLLGPLSRRELAAAVPDFSERTVYCCGPGGFMANVRQIHAAEGARHAPFHIEHFRPVVDASPSRAEGLDSAGEVGGVHHATLGTHRFEVRAGETILAAASRQQVVIPCGCASGMCGTCRVRLVSGDVSMHHAGGIGEDDEANGWILACSSRPASDVELAF